MLLAAGGTDGQAQRSIAALRRTPAAETAIPSPERIANSMRELTSCFFAECRPGLFSVSKSADHDRDPFVIANSLERVRQFQDSSVGERCSAPIALLMVVFLFWHRREHRTPRQQQVAIV